MVQLLSSPTLAQNGTAPIPEDSVAHVSGVASVTARVLMATTLVTRQEAKGESNKMMTREEHAVLMKELHLKRAGYRPPRRAWSSSEAPPGQPAVAAASPLAAVESNSNQASPAAGEEASKQQDITVARPPTPPATPIEVDPERHQERNPRRRPALGPPRRSYSVMDFEPPPRVHRPSERMTITDLPLELHYTIADFLDPIDSTCLGLTNKHFYNIHRRTRGTVPLSTRRSGPNDLEWAWRLAGPLVSPATAGLVAAATTNVLGGQETALERLRVRGQVYCRKCGISRCELHRHLREWVGEGYEYCSVKQKFGRPAGEGAKEFCHMSSPKRPHRCGRHDRKVRV